MQAGTSAMRPEKVLEAVLAGNILLLLGCAGLVGGCRVQCKTQKRGQPWGSCEQLSVAHKGQHEWPGTFAQVSNVPNVD